MALKFVFLSYLLKTKFMRPLYTKKEFNLAKNTDILPCECYHCKTKFYSTKTKICLAIEKIHKSHVVKYCSKDCKNKSQLTKEKVNCKQCNIEFYKIPAEIKRRPNHFCSKSCAAKYNNTHKTHGHTRSKLEVWLENELTLLYPNLHVDFNKRDTINSELDIYIPSLKLAFELNGIYHYEPIHGSKTLARMKNNDQRKFQACAEQKISLCIIDTSEQTYFKESTSKKFLNIINEIISSKQTNNLIY